MERRFLQLQPRSQRPVPSTQPPHGTVRIQALPRSRVIPPGQSPLGPETCLVPFHVERLHSQIQPRSQTPVPSARPAAGRGPRVQRLVRFPTRARPVRDATASRGRTLPWVTRSSPPVPRLTLVRIRPRLTSRPPLAFHVKPTNPRPLVSPARRRGPSAFHVKQSPLPKGVSRGMTSRLSLPPWGVRRARRRGPLKRWPGHGTRPNHVRLFRTSSRRR